MERRLVAGVVAFVVAVVGSCYVNDLLLRRKLARQPHPQPVQRRTPRPTIDRLKPVLHLDPLAASVNAAIESGKLRLRFLPKHIEQPYVSGKLAIVDEDATGRLTYSPMNSSVAQELKPRTVAEIGTVLVVTPQGRTVSVSLIDVNREAVIAMDSIAPDAIAAYVDGLTKQKRRPEKGAALD